MAQTKVRTVIRRVIVAMLGTLLSVYAALLAIMFIFQSRFVYFPTARINATPSEWGLAYEDITLKTDDGLAIAAWYVPADQADAPAVLFCHGNGGNISHRLDSIRILHELGLQVLIFDYRGYGQSEGKPTEPGTYLDAEAAWKYLTDARQVPPDKIVLFGRSLGGAVASYLAQNSPPAALILESTFTSIPDVAGDLYPYLPVHKISRFGYHTLDYVQRVSCPVLVIHSPDDDIIPYAHGRRLYDAAAEPKEFLEITGDHNYGFIQTGAAYTNSLRTFLNGQNILAGDSLAE